MTSLKRISNRLRFNLCCLLAAGLFGQLPLRAADAPAPRPNIIYLLMDDMGFSDCGFNGGTQIKTPNIDALAAQGSIFDNYYVQPLCSAARASLMTGRYPLRYGIYGALKTDSKYGLPLDERILPQAMHDAGYTTAICGKWHLGEFEPAYRPMHRGWDHQYGFWYGQIDYFTHERGGRIDWYRDDQPCSDPGYTTFLIAKEAIRLMEAQPKDKPLFLYVPFNAVHGPFQVSDKYSDPYRATLPPPRATLAGMLAAADEAIGQIAAALKATHMDTNTLIIFSSDNGGVAPGVRTLNAPLRDGKGTIYEGGVRSSAFVVWPGKIAVGKRISPPVHLVDWYPTLVKLAGGSISQPLPLDGMDIGPLLTEGKAPDRDAILLVGTPQRYAIRMGDWKLLVNPNHTKAKARKDPDDEEEGPVAAGDQRVELYNLKDDISETKNLAASEPDRVKMMRARLEEYMKMAVPSLNVTPAKGGASTM